jgi:hypothetical protein
MDLRMSWPGITRLAPAAHEDNPERAVRAALAIRGGMREEEGIQVRLAVHTGEALIMLAARPGHGEEWRRAMW